MDQLSNAIAQLEDLGLTYEFSKFAETYDELAPYEKLATIRKLNDMQTGNGLVMIRVQTMLRPLIASVYDEVVRNGYPSIEYSITSINSIVGFIHYTRERCTINGERLSYGLDSALTRLNIAVQEAIAIETVHKNVTNALANLASTIKLDTGTRSLIGAVDTAKIVDQVTKFLTEAETTESALKSNSLRLAAKKLNDLLAAIHDILNLPYSERPQAAIAKAKEMLKSTRIAGARDIAGNGILTDLSLAVESMERVAAVGTFDLSTVKLPEFPENFPGNLVAIANATIEAMCASLDDFGPEQIVSALMSDYDFISMPLEPHERHVFASRAHEYKGTDLLLRGMYHEYRNMTPDATETFLEFAKELAFLTSPLVIYDVIPTLIRRGDAHARLRSMMRKAVARSTVPIDRYARYYYAVATVRFPDAEKELDVTKINVQLSNVEVVASGNNVAHITAKVALSRPGGRKLKLSSIGTTAGKNQVTISLVNVNDPMTPTLVPISSSADRHRAVFINSTTTPTKTFTILTTSSYVVTSSPVENKWAMLNIDSNGAISWTAMLPSHTQLNAIFTNTATRTVGYGGTIVYQSGSFGLAINTTNMTLTFDNEWALALTQFAPANPITYVAGTAITRADLRADLAALFNNFNTTAFSSIEFNAQFTLTGTTAIPTTTKLNLNSYSK